MFICSGRFGFCLQPNDGWSNGYGDGERGKDRCLVVSASSAAAPVPSSAAAASAPPSSTAASPSSSRRRRPKSLWVIVLVRICFCRNLLPSAARPRPSHCGGGGVISQFFSLFTQRQNTTLP